MCPGNYFYTAAFFFLCPRIKFLIYAKIFPPEQRARADDGDQYNESVESASFPPVRLKIRLNDGGGILFRSNSCDTILFP